MKKLITILIIICASTSIINAQSSKKYSTQEVKEDLKYMYETLENSNYNLFAIVEKTEMDRAYESLLHSINDSLTLLEVYRLFQPFVAKVGMSHCNLSRPWGAYGAILNKEASMFPLHLHFAGGKVYVKKKFTEHEFVNIADEVLSINEQAMDQLLIDIYKYMSGPSNYYKSSILEAYSFPRLYWLFYGEREKFNLKIKNSAGEESIVALNSISGNKLEAELNKPSEDNGPEREFYLTDQNTAYLRPGKFSNINQDHNTTINSEFCHFVDSAFLEFNKMGAESLVLDLRNNTGGNNVFSDHIISYFADKPYRIASRFPMKTSQMTKHFFKDVNSPEHKELKAQIMTLENGTYFESKINYTQPNAEPNRFIGKVYVLVNRYSYSMSACAAAIIQDHQFGVIIGEETAEQVSSYLASHNFKLPNTQISVQYPKGFAVRASGDETLRGVVPDHIVQENRFTDEDEILDYTIKLIEERND